jgi:hypothetical protein
MTWVNKSRQISRRGRIFVGFTPNERLGTEQTNTTTPVVTIQAAMKEEAAISYKESGK